MESGVKLACVPVRGSPHEWFGPCLVSWLPGLHHRDSVAEPNRLRPHGRSPITRRGRVRTMDGPDPGRQSLRQPRNQGAIVTDSPSRMAPQQCRSDRESRWSPLRQLAARWATLTNTASSIELAQEWWRSTLQSIDRTGLGVEKNFQRYRRHANPVCVRVDSAFDESQRSLIDTIVRESDLNYLQRTRTGRHCPEAVIESTRHWSYGPRTRSSAVAVE